MPEPYGHGLPNPVGNFPGQILSDPARMRALGMRRRCSVCGFHLRRDRPVWRWWEDPDTSERSGIFTAEGVGPQHLSCCLFGALCCPWARSATARGRKSAGPRGPMAIRGFAIYGVMSTPECEWLTYVYENPVDVIPCNTHWRDLLPAYKQAVADDSEDIDMTTTRLQWSNGPEDVERLAECALADEARLHETD